MDGSIPGNRMSEAASRDTSPIRPGNPGAALHRLKGSQVRRMNLLSLLDTLRAIFLPRPAPVPVPVTVPGRRPPGSR